MAKILLQNNIVHGLAENSIEDTFFYAPLYHNKAQKDFHLERFQNLINLGYKISWCEEIDESDFTKVYAWNSSHEKEAFGSKLSLTQNRLFEILPFECPDGFSKFKKKVIPLLPNYFKKAHLPIDIKLTEKLDNYFSSQELVHHYFDTRNQLIGDDFSTKLSLYLSTGHLDVRHLYNEVKSFEAEYYSNKSSQWIIFELLWREFFYWHFQKHQNSYFSKNGIKDNHDFSVFKNYTINELKNFNAHQFFKCAIKELENTGFLSNRARQMFASIWINDLDLDWRSGANLFERYLIDHDVYSNYGNWMYLAGVGVDPRGKRYFKIDKQLDIYDPKGEYLKFWSN